MSDLNQIAAALNRKDMKQAAQLIKQLQKDSPQNPWVQFYVGRYWELTHKTETAETVYRQLLRDTTNPKVVAQARQALQRLEDAERQRRKEAIAESLADPRNAEPALLILEPISPEDKPAAIQTISRIFKTDPYTTRIQLQSRGWRLYKTGTIGELRVYCEELQKGGIPIFWAGLTDLPKINVFRVQYFQTLFPQPTAVCKNEFDQLGSLTFKWSEVSQRVEGLLPLFIEVMDYGPHRRGDKFRHKEITQDYAQVCDLHLMGRNSILRLCDQTYQFQQGIDFTRPVSAVPLPPKPNALPSEKPKEISHNTTRLNWNNLLSVLNQQLAVTVWSDFTPFAETTLDYTQMLGRIKSHIDLDRKSESPWDSAFQLYSGLVFLKGMGHQA